ncbi:hypothetical protein [Vibrio sp. Hep-1b-8]|uniref:hypothetical protein n=1 Tax=Vibrio sp. Hep-1b-8 TaxID=2144187 RepID=UPI00110FFFA4|nr:hypothetical protein [Vibrio sp. Hep-1b-8]TMX47463.1 hypothetical protein DA100_00730 [Vibrio sp. Hep-1b-8]
MNITVLDDYQDVVKSLECFKLLTEHDVTVFSQSYSEDELAVKLADTQVLVLIRERTVISESFYSKTEGSVMHCSRISRVVLRLG